MAINTSGFGAYDIRGIYPDSINQELAYRVGRVFPEIFNAKKVAVSHDIRLSGPTIFDALALRHRAMWHRNDLFRHGFSRFRRRHYDYRISQP